ncbi:sigma-54-dependent Fis family transcriptional regulator [Lysobacteraceae bacterium NML93-0399]|nr:sigma-54-dependent Fis family transcriptional regulator [Xanthomonadaceae bacterium NML93-0399]
MHEQRLRDTRSDLLIIDDDSGFVASVAELARVEGYVPRLAGSVSEGRTLLRHSADLTLLDLNLPDGSGLDLLGDIDRARHGRIAIITGHPSVDTAMRVVGGPVDDYLLKPFDPVAFVSLLRDSKRGRGIEAPRAEPLPGVIAASAAMREPIRSARSLAATEASILLTGEAGTGKDLFARALHTMSGRTGAFVRLSCGSTPRERLVERLLGPDDAFEDAAGGTLFLDEITDLPADLQGALLGRIERNLASGADGARLPARIVAASRLDPDAALTQGRLREDLYYRIGEIHLPLPPLRQREDDVLLLARRFVSGFNRRYDLDKRLAPQSARVLRRHGWPGNVRELHTAVHRAYLTTSGDDVSVTVEPGRVPPPLESGDTLSFTLGTPWADIERRMLLKALAHCGNDKTATARLLGISVRTVHNHLARMKD